MTLSIIKCHTFLEPQARPDLNDDDDDDNNNNNNNNKAKLHKIGTMHCSESNRKTKQEHDHEIDHGSWIMDRSWQRR